MSVNTTASDLETIRKKVRRVTGRHTNSDISEEEVDFYINTYLIYDFPEQIKNRILQTNYEFPLNANQDTYNFPVEKYVLLQNPIFCDGYFLNFYQNQEIFYASWAKPSFIQTIGTGNGSDHAPNLSNLSSLPVNRRDILLSTTISGNSANYRDNGDGEFLSGPFTISGITKETLAVITLNTTFHGIAEDDEVFIQDVFGMTQINARTPYTVISVSGENITISYNSSENSSYEGGGTLQRKSGSVNYITGAISMDWGSAPDANADIKAHYYPYVGARPNSVLFFGDKLIFRPIPDQSYLIRMQVYQKPSILLQNSQSPELRQWWQLIAYGAALKIFADSLDMESYEKCVPLFKEQEILAMRSTTDQKSLKKVITPYSDVPTSGTFPYDYFGV